VNLKTKVIASYLKLELTDETYGNKHTFCTNTYIGSVNPYKAKLMVLSCLYEERTS